MIGFRQEQTVILYSPEEGITEIALLIGSKVDHIFLVNDLPLDWQQTVGIKLHDNEYYAYDEAGKLLAQI